MGKKILTFGDIKIEKKKFYHHKVTGLGPAASYVQRCQLMSKYLSSGWKWYRGLKEIVSPFPCCPMNCECSWKKT